MSATVLPLDADGHHAIQALLPWYANGRLDGPDRTTVEAHLAGCPACRSELDWERKMLSAHATSGRRDADAEPGLALLHRRIRVERGAAPAPAPARRRHSHASALPWLAAVQFAAIAILAAFVLVPRAPPPTFHALGSSGAPAAANLVVRFRPDASEQDVRHALQAAGARIIDGPTVTDAYVLSVPRGRQAAALASLRARPVVELANSLEAESGP